MLKKQYKVFESEALTPSEKAQIVKLKLKSLSIHIKTLKKFLNYFLAKIINLY